MPGDYTEEDIRAMSTVEFQAAKARNWKRNDDESQKAPPAAPTSPPGEYGASWGGGGAGEYDFVTPSGERCRMRSLEIEKLLEAGILDQVSRLEGLADSLIQSAEGAPPTAKRIPSREEFGELLTVINALSQLAVVKPPVVADDASEVPPGAVRVSWISLEDRSAIMERALRDLRALDRFRNAG